MYEFGDYFDKDRRKNGYSSSADELDDYLRIIDMIIESLLEHRGLNKENKLFSRGLVITESELKRYYDMPPGIRDRDICDPALHLLHHLAAYEKRRLLVLDMEKLCGISGETRRVILTNAMILMKRGGTLLSLSLDLKDAAEKTEKTSIDYREREMALVRRIIKDFSDCRIFVFGSSEEPHELSVMGVPSLCIPAPTAMQRILMWEWFLGNSDIEIAEDVKVPDLADCYEISYGKIRDVCTHAVAGAKLVKSASLTRDMILESMMKINHVDFSSLASRISVLYKWEDLTIPDGQAEILHSACDRFRVRNRVAEKLGLKKKNAYGNGVSILLYGPPGTGKTMAAQVVANELSLPLFRVDISRIFSKYIGETEKNLSAIFDAAKGANVILFFDEADALFSKRTQIKDSNDKYSNSETAYLLQKIEEYDGMSILATNYYDNFDSAFIRRITYAVHLENPDENQRYLLWTTILPAETKFDKDMDFQFIANRFELS
ncbi:ATP-binding protein [Butyrivibrio sp. VCD2006]|uniref:ATP-binding protein n=1 Tax=Butyrivibrio sp. VCD2006 TaxID=1280664 RepID=UPI00040BC85C|nr:ATP-binding protein [Butyrivibrio sp. VCD2006]